MITLKGCFLPAKTVGASALISYGRYSKLFHSPSFKCSWVNWVACSLIVKPCLRISSPFGNIINECDVSFLIFKIFFLPVNFLNPSIKSSVKSLTPSALALR